MRCVTHEITVFTALTGGGAPPEVAVPAPGEQPRCQKAHAGSTSTTQARPDSMQQKSELKRVSACPYKVPRCTTWWHAGENVGRALNTASLHARPLPRSMTDSASALVHLRGAGDASAGQSQHTVVGARAASNSRLGSRRTCAVSLAISLLLGRAKLPVCPNAAQPADVAGHLHAGTCWPFGLRNAARRAFQLH